MSFVTSGPFGKPLDKMAQAYKQIHTKTLEDKAAEQKAFNERTATRTASREKLKEESIEEQSFADKFKERRLRDKKNNKDNPVAARKEDDRKNPHLQKRIATAKKRWLEQVEPIEEALKAIVTRKNKDGTYDKVGMRNRTVIDGSEKTIQKGAKKFANGPHRIEYHHHDSFFKPAHKTVHVEDVQTEGAIAPVLATKLKGAKFDAVKPQSEVGKPKKDGSVKEEKLDELSKGTLASYIKKAHVSGLSAAASAEENYGLAANSLHRGKAFYYTSRVKQENKKGEKREQGINRAVTKLAREEVLDEATKAKFSKQAVEWIVNKHHVGTSDEDVAKDITNRTASWNDPTQTKLAVSHALKHHKKNQGLYDYVMKGR